MGTGAWSMLCQHQILTFFRAMEEDAFPTFDVLEQRWTEEECAMRDYLARLSDDDVPKSNFRGLEDFGSFLNQKIRLSGNRRIQ